MSTRANTSHVLAKYGLSLSYRYWFEMTFDGGQGMLLAVSTNESTRHTTRVVEGVADGIIILEPHWMHFRVWFFDGMVPMNIWDLRWGTDKDF